MTRQSDSPQSNRSSSAKPREIELYIEQLVLHGFSRADRNAIAAGLQRELAHLIAQGGLPSHDHLSIQRIDAGAFQIKAGAGAQNAGEQTARSLFRGVRQQMRSAARERALPSGSGGRIR